LEFYVLPSIFVLTREKICGFLEQFFAECLELAQTITNQSNQDIE